MPAGVRKVAWARHTARQHRAWSYPRDGLGITAFGGGYSGWMGDVWALFRIAMFFTRVRAKGSSSSHSQSDRGGGIRRDAVTFVHTGPWWVPVSLTVLVVGARRWGVHSTCQSSTSAVGRGPISDRFDVKVWARTLFWRAIQQICAHSKTLTWPNYIYGHRER